MSQDKKDTVNKNERSILAAQENSLSVPNSVLGLNPTNNIVASATNVQPYSMISKIIMINRIVDNKGPVTGSFLNGTTTDDDTPELQGVVTTALNPDEMIVIFRDGVPVGVATLNLTSWSFTDAGLESGKTYVYTAQIQDINGNTSNMSSSFSIVTQFSGGSGVNQLITLDSIVDDVDPVKGIIAVNGKTNDTTPTLNGKLSEALLAGESIVIYRNGVEVGTAVVTGTNWTYTSAPLATDGSYIYKAAVRNATGVDTQVSNEYKIILDTAPVVIQSVEITSIIDDANPVTGAVLNGGFTNDKTPLLKGRINPAVLPGDTVLIYRDGVYKGTAQLSGSDWQFTDTLVTDGTYNYTAVIKNQAGVEGPASSKYTITLDTVVPSVLVLDSVMDAVGPVTGPILPGGITDDKRPVLNGHGAEPGSTIVLKDKNGNVLNEVTADATGAWSVRPDPFKALVDGLHTLQIVQVDKAGNESAPIKFVLTVDTVVIPDPTGTVTVDSFSGADTTPTIKGSYSVDLLTGEFIQVKVNGVTYKQGDGHLSVNTTTHTWVLTIPDQNALNVDGQTDVIYDVVAQKVNSLGKVVNDQSSNELTVYRDVTINTGFTPNNMTKQPLFTGTAKLNVGSGEQLVVKIVDSTGHVVRTFSSVKGAYAVDGLQLDTVNNTWSINNSNWGSNQLVAGNYTVQSLVIPADHSTGGQSSTVEHITVALPTEIVVPNKSDNSDINAKLVALSDGGFVLVWAQNQNEKIHSMYSKYDVVMQRYDQMGNRVGTLKNLTNTNIKPHIYARESEGYADRGDMWNNSGSLNVMLNLDGTLAVNYNSYKGHWVFKDNYDLNGNRISQTIVKNGEINPKEIETYNFGFNEVQTSNGKVTIFTSGTVHEYDIMASNSSGKIQRLTDENDGANGYLHNHLSYTPLGGRSHSLHHACNSESVSAISLGGNKYLVQYAEFNKANYIKNLTKETLEVYEYNGSTSTLKTSMTANNFDNGWQLGAKSISLKEGGFVSLWLSNHSGASSISDKGRMDDFDVYARRFNYDANTNSLYAVDASEKRVNTTTNGVNGMGYDTLTTGGFSGAALEHGGYVVVWVKMISQSAGEVYSQVFDAAGNQVGGETLVSTHAVDGYGSVNLLPSVAGLKDGGYVISWANVATNDYAVNSFASDIKMAMFNADGSMRGGTTAMIGRGYQMNPYSLMSEDDSTTSAEYLTGSGVLTATKNGVTTLDGRQGATDLIGGSANDYFIIKDTNFHSILGGEGIDSLIWDSAANLRLADLISKIQGIEVVHLGDQYDNRVEVSLNDVLNLSTTTNTLMIQGGRGDQVVLEQDQWVVTSTQNYQGETYQVYAHNDNLTASLWIQNHLGVIG